jgi:hypothetical protein
MNNKLVLIYYKVGFALLALYAVAVQIIFLQRNLMFVPSNFFSYFTVESNLLAAAVFLVSAWLIRGDRGDKKSRVFEYLRGAAVLYMVITGLVYSILLSGADVQTPLPFVDTVLHYVFPVVVLIDWLIDRPSRAVPMKVALLWLSFPVAYVVYSLVRGSIVGWYPYPFLDVTAHGYTSVATVSVILAVCTVILSWLVAKLGSFQAHKQ